MGGCSMSHNAARLRCLNLQQVWWPSLLYLMDSIIEDPNIKKIFY